MSCSKDANVNMMAWPEIAKVKGARFQTFQWLGAKCSWRDPNMPNKQSSTKRFRTGTAINLNDSTNYLRKPMIKQLPVILILHILASPSGGGSVVFHF